MNILKGLGDFFALDIGTNAIRVVQLKKAGAGYALEHYGYAPIDSKLTGSDSEEARRKVGEVIMTAVGQSGIKSKNVVIGLPSSKTFTTIIDVPMVSEAELKATMKYQIDQYIPMSVDDAKVDWALLGNSLRAQNQQEVLLSSVARQYSEDRLELVEALGFNVIAAEPDPIAMVRALSVTGATGAVLQLDMGENSTDIAIVYGDTPRLVRTIPTGVGSLVKSTVTNLNVQEDQARQFILKFGLAPDRLEGQVLRALESVLDNFAAEVVKSIKFFETRYPSIAVGGVIVTGFAATIPQFDQYLAGKVGKGVQLGNPWQGIQMAEADQRQPAAVAMEFSTVIGLAKRGVEQ
ncbi:MAG TPA: type IV pilus assembly protein PilM [Candidatus Saccharimonadales bacterium]|nr:type IV pilus assembly protein PilM [Candidatus Saccharimonadales bacterium]